MGHQGEGGDAFEKPLAQAALQDSPPFNPEAPCRIQSWTNPQTSVLDPVISQKYKLRPREIA